MRKVLDRYDGEKMVIDTEARQLFVWYDDQDEHEEWFVVAYMNHEYLVGEFLQRKISLLDLMRETEVKIAHRHYDNYSEFDVTDIVATEKTHLFPLDGSYYTGVKFSLPLNNFNSIDYFEILSSVSSRMRIAPDKYSGFLEAIKPIMIKKDTIWEDRFCYNEPPALLQNCEEGDYDWRNAA